MTVTVKTKSGWVRCLPRLIYILIIIRKYNKKGGCYGKQDY